MAFSRVGPALESQYNSAMAGESELERAWARVKAWLLANAPEVLDGLRPGLADDAIEALESGVDAIFPADFRAWLTLHGGQEPGPGMFPHIPLLKAEEIPDAWRDLSRRFENGMLTLGNPAELKLHGPVRRAWWSPHWIPFATDGNGNFLCLDLDPPARGENGQILESYRDWPERSVVAKSFTALLAETADSYASGKYVACEDAGKFAGIWRPDEIQAEPARYKVRAARPVEKKPAISPEIHGARVLLEVLLSRDAIAIAGPKEMEKLAVALAPVLAKDEQAYGERAERVYAFLMQSKLVEDVYCDEDELMNVIAEGW